MARTLSSPLYHDLALTHPSPTGGRSDICPNRGLEMVARRSRYGWCLHGLWSVSLAGLEADEQQRKSTGLGPKFMDMSSLQVILSFLTLIFAEASAFLIATQLRKVFIQRNPVSFLIVGLGALGAGYYGNKYYRAVIKGEHIRRYEVQKKQ